jgi:hypothetical protein
MKTNAKTEIARKGSVPAEKGATPAQNSKIDLALTERRKIMRPIPVPHAVESEGDTDWALFQELSNEKPPSGTEPEAGSR